MAKVEETPADHLEWETPLYRQALTQFEQALEHADVPANVAERLRYPERSLIVSVPVHLDDGTWRVFPGYRVQHSSVLGPTKGGVRFDANEKEHRTDPPKAVVEQIAVMVGEWPFPTLEVIQQVSPNHLGIPLRRVVGR